MIMNVKYYIAAAMYLAGASFVGGVWGLVSATTATKYVCDSSGDDLVTASKWLDSSRFVMSFLAVSLTLYRQFGSTAPKKDKAVEVFSGLGAGVTSVLFFVLVVTTGVVCGDNKCITDSAANNCASFSNCDVFNSQVQSMTDNSNACSNNANCCTPFAWTAANNYCSSTINVRCGSPSTLAERCFVYACSSQVPGAVERYVVGLVCMVLTILSYLALFAYEQQQDGSGSTNNQGERTLEMTSLARPDTLKEPPLPSRSTSMLRQRRPTSSGTIHYTPVQTSIEF